MAAMSDDEALAFLRDGTRTGHLATVRVDGRPHVKPIWFVVDGEPGAFTIVFTTGADTVGGRNLARDPQASLSVDDPHPAYSFVVVEGRADVIDDVVAVREAATRIAARYMGPERAQEMGERNGVPGELLVHFTPTAVIAQADLTD